MTRMSARSCRRTDTSLPHDDDLLPLSKDHGKIREIKDLYRSKKDANGNATWTTEIPSDVAEVAETAETAKYALLVRNESCYDGRRQFTIASIVVQSQILKDLLAEIFEGYTGITINVRRLEFSSPWHPFVHRWSKLCEMRDKLTETAHELGEESEAAVQRDCIVLLHNVLKEELRETVTLRDDLISEGVMTYELVWTLFEPGSIMLSGENATRVVSSSAVSREYQVASSYVDWDGQNFGFATRYDLIAEYQGSRPILSLPVYPLVCREDMDELQQKIIARSVKFEGLCGFRYQRYDGIAEVDTMCGRAKVTVHSRIVIDTEAWNSFLPNRAVKTSALGTSKQTLSNSSKVDTMNGNQKPGQDDVSPPHHIPDKCRLTEEQLLITASQLRGYSTKDKKWMYFETENVSDITWDENAFQDLVLPSKQKELIRSVAESQALNSDYFDDIISGKGQGMILLLNGPPGVGKTLTAESVAEVMKVPLYYMSSVDLGSDTSSIETTLSKVFKMVTKWKAVLLLDEADVFLEERTSHDLERNKLVSVFLRVLEYYTGTLFLTTNRGAAIDPAFQSRIHLRLNYSPLNSSSRETVWRNFIRTITYPHEFDEEDYRDLAEKDLNGRQIKNLLKTAVLLAAGKNEALGRDHVEFVLDVDPQG